MAKKRFGIIVALGAIAGSAAWIYKKYDSVKSMYQKVILFKGERLEFEEFEGEAIASMFSGVLLDLSHSEFTESETYLDLYGFCSGIRVLIPKDIEVVLEGTKKASGVLIDQDDDVHKTKTLYINYNLLASGLSISDNIDSYHDEHCCDDEECECEDEACCDEECECEDEACCDEESESNDEDFNDVESVNEVEGPSDTSTNEDINSVNVEEVLQRDSNDENDLGFDSFTASSDETSDLNVSQDDLLEEDEFEKLNQSAQELNQAASEVEDAIDQFVTTEDKEDKEDNIAIHNSDDDFFEV